MAALTPTPITANGDYDFPTTPGTEIILDMNGAFGTATFTLLYYRDGNWFSSGDSWTTAGGTHQAPVLNCVGTAMRLTVTNAGGTNVYTAAVPLLR